jgi:glycosyltransferase involved in cell wall biosynthesis
MIAMLGDTKTASIDMPKSAAIGPGTAIKVYVHLAYGYGAVKWQKNWQAGKIIGLNEEFPYGYNHAAQYGATIMYSTDYPENKLQKLIRYGFRWLLGFDFIHAWRNRNNIVHADVVWTHTESQTLAILLVFVMARRPQRPKLIGQTIWLIDEWPRFSAVRKAAYKFLAEKADILTFLSPVNTQTASELFPSTRVEFVKFGINVDYPTLPATPPDARKIRVLSVGNDRHRDWPTLIDAAKPARDIELRMLTATYKLRQAHENITAFTVDSNEALLAQFEWADVLVLPLKPNLHASGITVIEEAVILGVPVICSKVGGLEAYFQEGDVLYVDPFDPDQLRNAIYRVATDDALRHSMIANSKRRMTEAKISSQDYAKRHFELSMELTNPA